MRRDTTTGPALGEAATAAAPVSRRPAHLVAQGICTWVGVAWADVIGFGRSAQLRLARRAVCVALAKSGLAPGAIGRVVKRTTEAVSTALRAYRDGDLRDDVDRVIAAVWPELADVEPAVTEDGGAAIDLDPGPPPPFPDGMFVGEVVQAVCAAARAPRRLVIGDSHFTDLIIARRAVSVALRARGLSLSQIGAVLRRDHTTVLAHLRSYEAGERREAVNTVLHEAVRRAEVVRARGGKGLPAAAPSPSPPAAQPAPAMPYPPPPDTPVRGANNTPTPVRGANSAPTPVRGANSPDTPVRAANSPVTSEPGPAVAVFDHAAVAAEAKHLRDEHGWSIGALCDRYGLPPGLIAAMIEERWEHGARLPVRHRPSVEPLF